MLPSPTTLCILSINMANAAAKKSAAARQSASSTYLPIVAALNLLYVILIATNKRASLTTFQCIMVVTLVGLSYLSYRGVVDNHANQDFKNNKKSDDALAGGAFLDMLGLVSVVQFGSVLLSDKFYWLLLLIPTVGGWKLYSTVKGGLPGMPNATSAAASSDNEQVSEKDIEKRQKRAERRRRKW
mmetsp:Transcript_21089/g.31246  ORF Transcript_21089/g.31246 Transcript_21089/m.31246 type:complete len:185 (+) Transcript_21089:18-572(+)